MELKSVSPELVANDELKLRQSLKNHPQAADKEKVAAKKVAREFEAMFVGMMLKSMRATTGTDTLTGGGRGEEVYRSLLDQEYANAIAKQGSLGLAEMIERQLVRNK